MVYLNLLANTFDNSFMAALVTAWPTAWLICCRMWGGICDWLGTAEPWTRLKCGMYKNRQLFSFFRHFFSFLSYFFSLNNRFQCIFDSQIFPMELLVGCSLSIFNLQWECSRLMYNLHNEFVHAIFFLILNNPNKNEMAHSFLPKLNVTKLWTLKNLF